MIVDHSLGISLNPPQPPVTSSELTTTANTTTANVTPTSSSPGRIATDTGSTLPILPLATHAQSLMVGADVDAKGEGRDDDTESSKGLSFNILTTVSCDKLPGRKNMTSAFFSYSMSNSQSSDPTVSTYAYHFQY